MGIFLQNFNHGFAHGIFGRMFCGFNMFNWNYGWNTRPIFFMPQAFHAFQFNQYANNYSMPIWNFSYPNSNPVIIQDNSASYDFSNTKFQAPISTDFSFQSLNLGDTFVRREFKPKEKRSVITNPKYHSGISTHDNNKYNELILKYSKEYDVDPNLIKAIIKQESQFNPNAESKIQKNGELISGAQGLMQLMPETAKEQGVDNPFDPEQNIKGGVKYFKKLLNRYDGNVEKALAAYNWGMGNLEKKGLENAPKETREYIPKVLNYYKNYKNA